MKQIVHAIVFLLFWFGCVLSCPYHCICDSVVVDGKVGETVDCSYALLSSVPAISEAALKLDFSENRLLAIPSSIKLLHNLIELDFSNNRLGYGNDEDLPNDIFSTLINLKVLDLSDNYLKTFSPNTFNGLVQLEKLDLSENQIVHLPLGMFLPLPNTAVVCLGANSWNCSMCQFNETLERFLNDERSIIDVCGRGVPTCSHPTAFKGRRFTEVRLENIPVCDKEKPITTSPKPLTTSPTFISTAADLSTKLSIITEVSPHLIASAHPHSTTANSTAPLPELYSNSGNFLDNKTAKLIMVSPHHGLPSYKDDNKGDSQLFVAAAIVIMGVMTLTIFLVFSIMVLKMQKKYRQVSIGHVGAHVDAPSPVSPWPLLQGCQMMEMRANDTEFYEEIPFNYNSNHKNEHCEETITSDKISEIQLYQPAKNGSEQVSTKADNPYKTVLHSQSNPMIAKLQDASWDTSYTNYESNDNTAATDCSGTTAFLMPLNNDNGLSQSTPYMVMHSPTEKKEMKDLYYSFET